MFAKTLYEKPFYIENMESYQQFTKDPKDLK